MATGQVRRHDWLRIELDDGGEGWISITDLTLSAAERANVRLLFDAAAAPITIQAEDAETLLRLWPGGAETELRFGTDPRGVLGRSLDGEWLAVPDPPPLRGFSSELQTPLWVQAADVELLAPDLEIGDLPVFVGRETVIVSLRGDASLVLPPAVNWVWGEGSVIVGEDGEQVWRYETASGTFVSTPRPPGPASLSPDGRYIAVTDCQEPEGRCQDWHDVVIMPTTGPESAAIRFERARREIWNVQWHQTHVIWDTPIVSPGQWSANGEYLLVPNFAFSGRNEYDLSALTLDFSVLTPQGGRYLVSDDWLPPAVRDELNQRIFRAAHRNWVVNADGTLSVGLNHQLRYALDGALVSQSQAPPCADADMDRPALASPDAIVHVWWTSNCAYAAVAAYSGQSSDQTEPSPIPITLWVYRVADQEVEQTTLEPVHFIGPRYGFSLHGAWSPHEDVLLLQVRNSGAFLRLHAWAIEADPLRLITVDAPIHSGSCDAAYELSPNGRQVLVEAGRSSGSRPGSGYPAYSHDGLALSNGWIKQFRLYDREGTLEQVFRVDGIKGEGTRMRLSWSSDADWLAIGGMDIENDKECWWWSVGS